MNREKLIEILSKYFSIGDSDTYCLTRAKEGFAVGTVTIDDFQEFDENNVADLADYILKNTAEEVTLRIDLGDRTPEQLTKIARLLNCEIKQEVAKDIIYTLLARLNLAKETAEGEIKFFEDSKSTYDRFKGHIKKDTIQPMIDLCKTTLAMYGVEVDK